MQPPREKKPILLPLHIDGKSLCADFTPSAPVRGPGEIRNKLPGEVAKPQSALDFRSCWRCRHVRSAPSVTVYSCMENTRLREALLGTTGLSSIVGKSPAIQELFSLIRKVAPVDCNVLVQGDSGTGKALVALALHHLSPRRNQPFVTFNCGGFTEELISSELFGYEKGAFTGAATGKIGLLEAASGGTVFLDEVGEMPLSMACGLPVCATSVGGIPRLVESGQNGLLSQAGDVAALAENCCRLLEDGALCDAMQAMGFASILSSRVEYDGVCETCARSLEITQ